MCTDVCSNRGADGDACGARLCPNATGADIRSVCTEAGMYAIRARRKTVTEKDFLDAVNKVGPSSLPCVCAFAESNWKLSAELAGFGPLLTGNV